jgi:hypothetical protein
MKTKTINLKQLKTLVEQIIREENGIASDFDSSKIEEYGEIVLSDCCDWYNLTKNGLENINSISLYDTNDLLIPTYFENYGKKDDNIFYVLYNFKPFFYSGEYDTIESKFLNKLYPVKEDGGIDLNNFIKVDINQAKGFDEYKEEIDNEVENLILDIEKKDKEDSEEASEYSRAEDREAMKKGLYEMIKREVKKIIKEHK